MGDSDDSQDSGDTSTTGTDSNSFESGAEERRAHYPDVGYNEVEINLGRPPGNALTKLREYLKLSAITLRPATSFEDYVVYDAHGNAYDHDTLNESEEEADQPDVDALVKTARSGDNGERRIALLELANIADETPKAILSIVPQLTAELDSAEPAIQAETLNILSLTAREYPDQVTPAADAVIGFLDFDHHSTLQEDATSFVKAVAEQDPDAVVGAAPKLAALLQDDLSAEQVALSALRHIAETDPDAVVPAVPQILTYIEESQTGRRIGGLAVLGTISKAYPHVAEDVVPTARSLLDSENYKIRANAAGLLADFADEYPDQVRPAVPRTIELLGDDDKKVRYNATSILARVAKEYPDDVEPGIDPLIDALDDDFQYTRSNACWALGYLQAEQALYRLEELEDTDPTEEVRNAAAFAVNEIEDSSNRGTDS